MKTNNGIQQPKNYEKEAVVVKDVYKVITERTQYLTLEADSWTTMTDVEIPKTAVEVCVTMYTVNGDKQKGVLQLAGTSYAPVIFMTASSGQTRLLMFRICGGKLQYKATEASSIQFSSIVVTKEVVTE